MSKTRLSDGDVYSWTATAAKSSGDVINWAATGAGAIGIATIDGVTGDTIPLSLTGVHRLTKPTTLNWVVGQPVYWTGSAMSTTITSNTYVGKAWAAATAGANETSLYVLLNAAPNRAEV